MRILELFGGIGACTRALNRLGIDYEVVDYVEIDKYAVASYNAINGTNFIPQDITKWDKDIQVDLIMHGSPCQDFSIAGKQAGGDEGSETRSSLMYETLRIVNKLKPKYIIWENVKNLLSKKHKHNFDKYIEIMNDYGYNSYYKVLNAKDYGIPQNRERVFTISIRKDIDRGYIFPEKIDLEKRLKDLLENNVEEKYYLSDKMLTCFLSNGTGNYPRRERFLQNINRKNQNVANAIITTEGNKPTCNFVKEKQLGVVVLGNYTPSNHEASRIVDSNNLAPTVKENHGTVTATVVREQTLKEKLCNELVEKNIVQGGEIINHSYTNSKQRDTLDKYIESKNGIVPTMTTRPDCLGVAVRTANKGGYDIARSGDSVDLSYPNSTTRRGRVGKGVSQTLTASSTMNTVEESNLGLRIRKLTPLECWRLMGFKDNEFYRAEKVNSNAQLYKQAGNSIVVNVLEAILKNLLVDKKSEKTVFLDQLTFDKFFRIKELTNE